MILEDLIHEICIIVNSVEDEDVKGKEGKSIWRDSLPEELVELIEQRMVDPTRPPENTLFT